MLKNIQIDGQSIIRVLDQQKTEAADQCHADMLAQAVCWLEQFWAVEQRQLKHAQHLIRWNTIVQLLLVAFFIYLSFVNSSIRMLAGGIALAVFGCLQYIVLLIRIISTKRYNKQMIDTVTQITSYVFKNADQSTLPVMIKLLFDLYLCPIPRSAYLARTLPGNANTRFQNIVESMRDSDQTDDSILPLCEKIIAGMLTNAGSVEKDAEKFFVLRDLAARYGNEYTIQRFNTALASCSAASENSMNVTETGDDRNSTLMKAGHRPSLFRSARRIYQRLRYDLLPSAYITSFDMAAFCIYISFYGGSLYHACKKISAYDHSMKWMAASEHLAQANKLSGAYKAALKSIQYEPKQSAGYELAGWILMHEGRYAGAIRQFEFANHFLPDNDTQRRIAQCKKLMKKHKPLRNKTR